MTNREQGAPQPRLNAHIEIIREALEDKRKIAAPRLAHFEQMYSSYGDEMGWREKEELIALREHVARIDAALAALDAPPAASEWTPIHDGDENDGIETLDRRVGVWVYREGDEISLSTKDVEIFAKLPDDVRLCRRTPMPQPVAASVDAPTPDWDNAPEWAMWWAVDANGKAHWWRNKPRLNDKYDWWLFDNSDCNTIIHLPHYETARPKDWKQTLRQRPQPDA